MKLRLFLLSFLCVFFLRGDTVTTYGIAYIDSDVNNGLRYTYQSTAVNDPLSPFNSNSVSVPMEDITYCHPSGYVQCGAIAITPVDLEGLTDTYDVGFALESWDGENTSWTSFQFPVTGTWSQDGLDFTAQYTSPDGSIWASFTADDPVTGTDTPEPSYFIVLVMGICGIGLIRVRRTCLSQ